MGNTKEHLQTMSIEMKEQSKQLALAVCGAAIYSAGVNLFVVPAGLYSGGVMGLSLIHISTAIRLSTG